MESFSEVHWDTHIVGTGIGGATLGYALAQAGQKVLFCEKGADTLHSKESIRGTYPPSRQFSRSGRWSEWWQDRSERRANSFRPLLGIGRGGSSALYGMVFEKPWLPGS